MNQQSSDAVYTLAEICALADMPVRTVRYYVQVGLVDRPQGETRAARYGQHHLDQLLQIRKWTASGVSLDRIRELLNGDAETVPTRARVPGSVEMRSHVLISDGVELVVDAQRAHMSATQVREFIRGVLALHAELVKSGGETQEKLKK